MTPITEQQAREAFEAAACRIYGIVSAKGRQFMFARLDPDRPERYTQQSIEWAWQIWQAGQSAEAGRWFPIESATPSEVDVLVYCPGSPIPIKTAMLCERNEDHPVWLDPHCDKLGMFPPTHWHPLPAPPAIAEGGA